VYGGDTGVAVTDLEVVGARAPPRGTDWALGVEAGRRALLRRATQADELHREAIERLGRTRVRFELARAHLRYGEWLRRQNRRVDARTQLRAAHQALAAMGAEAFADRARRELHATGETLRKRSIETSAELTAHEARIARLVAEGLTNREIGDAMYISARTVEWHLCKIFNKLGVSTRRRLRQSLSAEAEPASSPYPVDTG
jgi:ATP/maltotriose-dependent transcriptional regulator MalT